VAKIISFWATFLIVSAFGGYSLRLLVAAFVGACMDAASAQTTHDRTIPNILGWLCFFAWTFFSYNWSRNTVLNNSQTEGTNTDHRNSSGDGEKPSA
jgi:UDP-N-acetylmuramyl pentapeptide phosphotransferase/UDP-N-acetylglucosamine-1-phosphate transferase